MPNTDILWQFVLDGLKFAPNNPRGLGWDRELLDRICQASGMSERALQNNVKRMLAVLLKDDGESG